MSGRLAFDIGGANLKAAHSDGSVRSVPFELWKSPERLADALRSLSGTLPDADAWLVTMTGELCDCFRTRSDGVRSILGSVGAAADGRAVHVWGTDGAFHSVASILERPLLAAASNWLALATAVARGGFGRSGLLIDVGSTTTDLIPWRDGEVLITPDQRTDFDRLQASTLVYQGVRRTPLMMLGLAVFGGRTTRVMAEQFATMADVFVTLGDIPPNPDDRSTANGQPLTVEASRDRLARMVGRDRDDFTTHDAREYAQFCERSFLAALRGASTTVVIHSLTDRPAAIVVAGSGEFLARRLVEQAWSDAQICSLADVWGSEASEAACAVALLRLAAEESP